MIKLEHSTVINRRAEEVWDFVSDCTNEPKWHTDCLGARLTSPPPLQVGSTQAWAMSYANGKEAQLRVRELEPGHREQLETVSAPMNVTPTLTYTLEPNGAATRFSRAMEFHPTGFTLLMQPFLRRMMAKNNAGYVQKLKEVLEQTKVG